MKTLLYPLKLDRQGNPISTIHREIALRIGKRIQITGFKEKKEYRIPNTTLLDSSRNKIADALIMHQKLYKNIGRFDGIHIVPNIAIYPLIKKAKKQGVKIIATIHESPRLTRKKSTTVYGYIKRMVYLADSVVSISSFVRREVKKEWGIESAVIPNGVDNNLFKPSKANKNKMFRILKTKKNQPIALFVGSLTKNKNPLLIPFFAKRLKNVFFVVIGDGTLKSKFQKSVKKLKNVRHIPFVKHENMAEWYASSDIFIFPARYEGFGMATLEAISCGTPVAGFDSGATKEIVNSKCGILVKNKEEMLQAIEDVINKRKVFKKNDLLKQAKRFSWDHVAKEYEKIYLKTFRK